MLLILFLSSALLLGPIIHAENVENVKATDSSRPARQYWPAIVAPSVRPMLYNLPWWSSYVPRYYPSYPFQRPSSQMGYPYDAPETRGYQLKEPEESGRLSWNGANDEAEFDEQVQSRQFSINNYFANRPFINNPNRPTPGNMNDGCKDPNGLEGMCLNGIVCRANGGRPSGACSLRSVCCINSVTTCGAAATMNNTYWQNPTTVNGGTNCAVAINLGNNLPQIRRPICQVRLDFVDLKLEQPNQQSVCDVDTFTVTGSAGTVPTICGANSGQHMYLTPLEPNGDMVMQIKIGTGTFARSWNIKIALLPCGGNFLAPSNCLQYFTRSAGSVKSFNYDDVIPTAAATRQLASQDYVICFRKELIADMAATRVCFTQCRTAAATGRSFSITTDATAAALDAETGTGTCSADFLMIPNAFDPNNPGGTRADRFCGTALNTNAAATAAITVCTEVRDFAITYRTNAVEPATAVAPLALDVGNLGFCLDYEERTG